jgi:hypothetical protein
MVADKPGHSFRSGRCLVGAIWFIATAEDWVDSWVDGGGWFDLLAASVYVCFGLLAVACFLDRIGRR